MDVEVKESASPSMGMGMKMYFHIGAEEMILFKGWMTHNWPQMLGSCIAVFVVAMLYEGMKVGRDLLQRKLKSRPPPKPDQARHQEPQTYGTLPGSITSSGNDGETSASPLLLRETTVTLTVKERILNSSHIIESLLLVFQVWISMCLMLVFMTYNLYLCLAVSLGAGAGYFAFAWLRPNNFPRDDNEHCN